MTASELSDWLRGVDALITATAPHFPCNVLPGYPIPFFGNVLKARVLTIGVNPSSTEFNEERQWGQGLGHSDWEKRLLNYFNWPHVAAHKWFESWSICLELLGISYAADSAAHLDISPRPTKAMIKNANTCQQEFRSMVEHDVKWIFQLLGALPQVQLLLVAGPIPKANGQKEQLADFIREQAGRNGAEWKALEPLPSLVTPSHPKGIPVFVCPYERNVDGVYAMVRQIYRNRTLLRRLVSQNSNSIPAPLMPAHIDWSAAIGNFITNFGMLDLHVHDYLESLLPPVEFLKLKERPLHDRVEFIKRRLGAPDCTLKRKAEFEQFFHQLDPLRETRNHIAHGVLRIGVSTDGKTPVQTLSLPRDLDGLVASNARHLEFSELQAQLKSLNGLIEDFQRLTGFQVVGRTPQDVT